jgi:hypothetical protein
MKRLAFALSLAMISAAIPATAHHSFDGTFDRAKQVKLTGKVTEFQFVNPHSFFRLAVTDADGTTRQWHIELQSASALSNRGWTDQSIKPGEALAVEGWPAKDGKLYIRLGSMTHADGSAVGLWIPPGPTPLPGA